MRALKTHLPGSPGIKTKRVRTSAYGRARYRRPNDPAVQRGGECYKDYLGLGNLSIFDLYSSVGNFDSVPRYRLITGPQKRQYGAGPTTVMQAASPVAWQVVRVPVRINFAGSSLTECMLVGLFLA